LLYHRTRREVVDFWMVDRMTSRVCGDALNPLLVGTSATVGSVRIRMHHDCSI
jgi:hypothetical protein